jgi:GAF domain-containing protein
MISQGPATQLTLSAAVDRLSAHAADWSTSRVLDEGLDLVRDCSWADGSVLYAAQADRIVTVCRRPAPGQRETPGLDLPSGWFPWGLGPVNPRRFIFVENAAALPAGPDDPRTLGDLEVSSCLHLPILERQQPIGALHLLWTEPRLVWDDDCGRILRSLGRFLLARATAPPAAASAAAPAGTTEPGE